jgi:branched-subunit amino acid ABC-type transport system permease component
VWAILVVIVGGMGSVQGTVLAALGLGLVEAFGGELLPFEYVHLLIYGLLVVALFWRSSGLLAAAERRV